MDYSAEDKEMSSAWTHEEAMNFFETHWSQGAGMQNQFTIDWKVEQDVKEIIMKATMEASMGSSSAQQKWFTRTIWLKQAANAVQKHWGKCEHAFRRERSAKAARQNAGIASNEQRTHNSATHQWRSIA